MAEKKEQDKNWFRQAIDVAGEETGITDLAEGAKAADPDLMLSGLEKLRRGPKPWPPPKDPSRDNFIASNSSYSGTDIVPVVQVGNSLLTLGSVQTISISVFREKEPIRVLGKSYAKGYTGGPRTIAGSITFIVFNRDPFWDILSHLTETPNTYTDRYSTPVADQIPPINLILWCSNEYGRKSILTLYGIEFNQEGQVHSINDVYSEKTVNYLARDYDILMDHDDIQGFRNLMYERALTGQFTDNYMVSLMEYKRKLEKEIHNVNNTIKAINNERAKRGIVSFGVTAILGGIFGNDLRDKQNALLLKKQQLVEELKSVNDSILAWSKVTHSSEDYFSGEGTASHDDLRQAALTTAAPRTPFEKIQQEIVTNPERYESVLPVTSEAQTKSTSNPSYKSTATGSEQ